MLNTVTTFVLRNTQLFVRYALQTFVIAILLSGVFNILNYIIVTHDKDNIRRAVATALEERSLHMHPDCMILQSRFIEDVPPLQRTV